MAVLLNILKTKHMKHNRIDRSIFLDIEEKFAEFKTINGLAKHYNVDNETAKKVLIEFGLDPDYYKKQENEIRNEAAEYYCQGNSVSRCCKKFNISSPKLIKTLSDRQLLRVDTNINLLCKICNQEFNSKAIFSKHILHAHGMKSKQYYDCFCKKSAEGLCVICNTETEYGGFINGYRNTCSHVCGGIFHRQNLKKDVDKHNKFVETVSSNAKKRHANMSAEEKALRAQKNSNSNKITNALMTPEERKQKYGWMNKLTEEEKNEFVRNVVINTGCHLWWKTSTDEEKIKVFEKRANTLHQNNTNELLLHEDFTKYRQLVTFLTEKTYKKFKQEINPHNLRRKVGSRGYHLDHKYSIFQGFVDGILPDIIACKHNLQMLPGSENISKGIKCTISLECLTNLYEKELKV